MQRRRRPSDLAQRDVGMLIPRLLEEVGKKKEKKRKGSCMYKHHRWKGYNVKCSLCAMLVTENLLALETADCHGSAVDGRLDGNLEGY
jgi:hypothetical protein